VLALILFVAALVIYAPILWAPGMLRGDMAGLFYAFVAVVTTIGVLLASAAVALLLRVYPPPQRA
jgi:hypothetical protein